MAQINDQKKRQDILKATIQSITKDFGISGSQILGDAKAEKIIRISSGAYAIDDATGGGYPRGRIIEIYGPESSGKTTVALHAIAEVQRAGGLCVFIDAENALDINYAEALGVDIQNLILAQPDSAEDCLQIAERWIDSGIVDLVVLDSVASMIPEAEMKADIGDNHIGLLARLMSQALRKLAYKCRKTDSTMIFINQIREKVGVMFGNPETTTGGRALKFYSSIRMEVRPAEIKKKDGEAVSRSTKIKIVKNKVAPPFREALVDIEFGEGIARAGQVLDYGSDLGIIQKSGSWYSYNDERLGQGAPSAKAFLKQHPHLIDEIDDKIRMYMNPPVEDYIAPPDEDDEIPEELLE